MPNPLLPTQNQTIRDNAKIGDEAQALTKESIGKPTKIRQNPSMPAPNQLLNPNLEGSRDTETS